jgi:trimethylamine:corrinoid methyltransferase-like protein
MNERDKSNLEFLMSLRNQKDWQAWAEICDEDDFAYAMELLQTALAEVEVQHMDLVESLQEEIDTTEAQAVLARFKL